MITIAWDVDDVLNDLMKEWLLWFSERKNLKIDYEQITENPPHILIGITKQEYLKSLDEFRLSEQYQRMKPTKEVFDWFETEGHRFRHIALTATPLKTAPTTALWVLRNYGRWIRTFHFVPSMREGETLTEYDRDKSEFLRWFGKVDFLIDDSEENVNSAKRIGVKALLWSRPWNSSTQSWSETLKILTTGGISD